MESKEEQNEFALTQEKDVPSSTSLGENVSTARAVAEKTDKKILEGLTNPYASTGTPIVDLSGGAKFYGSVVKYRRRIS